MIYAFVRQGNATALSSTKVVEIESLADDRSDESSPASHQRNGHRDVVIASAIRKTRSHRSDWPIGGLNSTTRRISVTTVTEAINSRQSTRAFLDKPVSLELMHQILSTAGRAPSGGNLQPWSVYVMTGQDLAALKRKLRETPNAKRDVPEYTIFPNPLADPFNARRKKCGEDLYAALEIPREDKQGRAAQFDRNYDFFGAPVGMIFAIDRSFGHAQWVHLGMFIQTVMLLAQEAGLATCAQEAWATAHKALATHLELPSSMMVYCGMSIGYADASDPVNAFRTERMTLDEFATFRGF